MNLKNKNIDLNSSSKGWVIKSNINSLNLKLADKLILSYIILFSAKNNFKINDFRLTKLTSLTERQIKYSLKNLMNKNFIYINNKVITINNDQIMNNCKNTIDIFVPKEIILNNKISFINKFVLSQVKYKCNKYKFCYDTSSNIAKGLGISKSSVDRAIFDLKKLNFIEVKTYFNINKKIRIIKVNNELLKINIVDSKTIQQKWSKELRELYISLYKELVNSDFIEKDIIVNSVIKKLINNLYAYKSFLTFKEMTLDFNIIKNIIICFFKRDFFFKNENKESIKVFTKYFDEIAFSYLKDVAAVSKLNFKNKLFKEIKNEV